MPSGLNRLIAPCVREPSWPRIAMPEAEANTLSDGRVPSVFHHGSKQDVGDRCAGSTPIRDSGCRFATGTSTGWRHGPKHTVPMESESPCLRLCLADRNIPWVVAEKLYGERVTGDRRCADLSRATWPLENSARNGSRFISNQDVARAGLRIALHVGAIWVVGTNDRTETDAATLGKR
jgi:hypothetical protein